MSVGDLVKWIGFPGANVHPSTTGPTSLGIVIKVWNSPYNGQDKRINVMWGNGTLGKGLYPQTVEVVSESWR